MVELYAVTVILIWDSALPDLINIKKFFFYVNEIQINFFKIKIFLFVLIFKRKLFIFSYANFQISPFADFIQQCSSSGSSSGFSSSRRFALKSQTPKSNLVLNWTRRSCLKLLHSFYDNLCLNLLLVEWTSELRVSNNPFKWIALHKMTTIKCRKPKTQHGKRKLAKPKIVELAKQSLMLRGATASTTSLQFIKELVLNSIIIYFFYSCRIKISFHVWELINESN